MSSHLTLQSLVGALFLSMSIYMVHKMITAPTFSIPGPFLTRFSRLRFLWATLDRHMEKDNHQLHSKYGKIVRIAPRTFIVDDPAAIADVYGVHAKLEKASYYSAFEFPGRSNVFSNRNRHSHAFQRKKMQKLFAPASMASYEKYVDDCVSILMTRLEERVASQQQFDLAWWLQGYAFDVIGYISFSKRFGFLDRGEDARSLINSVHRSQRIGTVVAVFPEIAMPVFFLSLALYMMGILPPPAVLYYRQIGDEEWMKRTSSDSDKSEAETKGEEKPQDFLSKYMGIHFKDTESFSKNEVHTALGSNIAAGSDTTGVALASIIYYLFTHPQCLSRVRRELRAAQEAGQVSKPMTFKDSQSLVYLQAVIKESLRCWPSFCVPLLRQIPSDGVVVAGQVFSAGDVVGVNPYVACRNRGVFGDNADEFIPERWLPEGNSPEKLAEMNRYWIPFGVGSRVCLGKHISMLEIGKLIPAILDRFDFELNEDLLVNGPKSKNLQFVIWENLIVKARHAS